MKATKWLRVSAAAKKDNERGKKEVDWEEVRRVIKIVERNGGEVINQPKKPRTFQLHERPGIKLLGYGDFLKTAGFVRTYSVEEIEEIATLRGAAR
jgi:hypothetical protein